MKRLILSVCCTLVLVLGSMPEAYAHGGSYSIHFGYTRYAVRRHGHHYPVWLNRHHDFQRWYWHSPYRYDFYLSWHQLYDIYRYDRKYHRRHHRDHHRRHRHHRHH